MIKLLLIYISLFIDILSANVNKLTLLIYKNNNTFNLKNETTLTISSNVEEYFFFLNLYQMMKIIYLILLFPKIKHIQIFIFQKDI